MSVCTRKDGQVFVQWKEGGKTRRKYFGNGPDSREQARQYNAAVTRRTVTGGVGGLRFNDLVIEYLRAKRATMPEQSLKNLGYKLAGVIVPAIGHLQVQNITPERLDRYVSERSKTVKNTTIHRELSDIRAILNWSVRRRLIHHNPMSGFQLPARDDAVEIIRRVVFRANGWQTPKLQGFFQREVAAQFLGR